MKRIIALLLVIFTANVGFCQQNLTFNRVITHSGSLTGFQTLALDTVPPGKVWKIEAKGFSGDPVDYYWTFNGKKYYNIWSFTTGGSPISTTSNFNDVIWLKAGDRLGLQYGRDGYNCTYCTRDYFISILEFIAN